MTPLTTNPTVNILRHPLTGEIVLVATNVAPNLVVTETTNAENFGAEAKNKPFTYDPAWVTPEPVYNPANNVR